MTDLKIYGLNGLAMAINFTSIEIGLKIILSAIVIGYTIHKWVLMHNKAKKKSSLLITLVCQSLSASVVARCLSM